MLWKEDLPLLIYLCQRIIRAMELSEHLRAYPVASAQSGRDVGGSIRKCCVRYAAANNWQTKRRNQGMSPVCDKLRLAGRHQEIVTMDLACKFAESRDWLHDDSIRLCRRR
jgi:hypothetical protein